MLKRVIRTSLFLFVLIAGLSPLKSSLAATRDGQFQLGIGMGVFVGTDGLDASFDIALEPEYFFTEHISASFRFDATVGGVDSVHFGGRFRYYLTFKNHTRWSIFFGAGAGGVINFDGSNFGDIAIPVFGFQYDLTDHMKLGSDVSFNILFNGDNAEFGTRLLPVVFKWAF